jgi:hypothetical protein
MLKWGWMRKKGSDRRNWSDRWVILSKSGELKYFLPPPLLSLFILQRVLGI